MTVHQIQKTRLTKLSLYYYLQSQLTNDSLNSVVAVKNDYPDSVTGITPPTLVVSSLPISFEGWQLGGNDRRLYDVLIDIFGINGGQRDDLSDIVYGYLNRKQIPIWDYNEGLPPSIVTRIGTISVQSIEISEPLIIDLIGAYPENVKWNRQLTVRTFTYF